MVQEIRDKILSLLGPNFNGEQLAMIDKAVAESLKGYRVVPEETLPEIRHTALPEVGEFLARKKSKGLSAGSLEQYQQVLKAFCVMTPKAINDIKDWDVLKFLDWYESCRGIGRRRKDTMRVILNGFFRYMADSGKVTNNPMATIEPIKFKKKVRQPLSSIEFEKLRRACKSNKERAIVEFLFATGCRVSEVVNLTRDDIDYFSQTIKVTGKGDKERYVYINAPAIVALDEYFKERTDNSPEIFVSDRRPHMGLKKNAIEKIIRIIGERAGLSRRVFPHLIRHTMASHLYNHGMRLEDLQVLLGHESADTTRIYAKDDPALTKHAYMMAA